MCFRIVIHGTSVIVSQTREREMKTDLMSLACKRLLEKFFEHLQKTGTSGTITSAMFLIPEFKRFIRDTYYPGSKSLGLEFPVYAEIVYSPESIIYVSTLISNSIETVETIYWGWASRQQDRVKSS